jgi:two-component sensor histidine kinase
MAPHVPPDSAVALDLALALVASSTTPLLLLDGDLTVVAASKSFCGAFQIDPARTNGCHLAGLGAGEWNAPQLSSLLRATASGHAEVEDYEMELVRDGLPPRCLVLNARKLDYAEKDDIRVILSIADVTDARIAEKLKEGLLRDKDVLLQELHHRVANSLQIIASVLMQSARKVQSDETRGHLFDAHQRVMSVAALQQQLAASRVGNVGMRSYLTALCDSISASMIRDRQILSLEVRADDSTTTADTSVSIGLIVTELVINALKHAFPGNRGGTILVDYHARGPNWTLSVDDNGVGMPENPDSAKPRLGTSIVEALAKQLGAHVAILRANPGTTVSVVHTFVPVLVGKVAAESGRAV